MQGSVLFLTKVVNDNFLPDLVHDLLRQVLIVIGSLIVDQSTVVIESPSFLISRILLEEISVSDAAQVCVWDSSFASHICHIKQTLLLFGFLVK